MLRPVLVLAACTAALFFTAAPASAAPTDLDATFSGDGKQTLDVGSTKAAFAQGLEVVTDSSNRTVVAGTVFRRVGNTFPLGDIYLARYNANGTLDTTFSGDGYTTIGVADNDRPTGLAIDSQGRIVIGAWADAAKFVAIRFTSSGTLDTSFGKRGVASIDTDGEIGGFDFVNDLTLDGDKPLLAGSTPNGAALVRLTAAGVPDTAFGGGDGITLIPSMTGSIAGVAVGSDAFTYLAGSDEGSPVVRRYDSAGALAPTGFGGGDGIADVPAGFLPTELTIATGAGAHAGKLVLSGHDGSNFAAARLNVNGTPDTSFGGDGVADVPVPGYAGGIAVDVQALGSGLVTLAGSSNVGGGSDFDFAVARLTATGTADTTYGDGDGHTETSFVAGAGEEAHGATFRSDGTAVLIGSESDANKNPNLFIARYTPAGILDDAFDGDGKVFGVPIFDSTDRFNAVVRNGTGYIAVGSTDARADGVNDRQILVARYLDNGNPDTGFSGDGRAVIPYGASGAEATDVAIDTSGRIVVVGTILSSSPPNEFRAGVVAARLTATGDPDVTFGGTNDDPDGVATVYQANQPVRDPSVAVDGLNRLVIGGSGDVESSDLFSDFKIYRLTTAGALDTAGFNSPQGYIETDLGSQYEFVTDVGVTTDNRIIAVGDTESQLAIAKYTTAGALDATFSGGATSGYDIRANTEGAITSFGDASLAIDADGKITIGGSFDRLVRLTRYLANGTVDPAFASSTGGIAEHDFTNNGADHYGLYAFDMQLDPAGRPVVAGTISTIDNETSQFSDFDLFVSRFNTDGSLSENVDPGNGMRIFDVGGVHGQLGGVAITPTTGQILVVGSAEAPGGDKDAVLARFVGAPDPGPNRTLTVDTASTVNGTGNVSGQGISCAEIGLGPGGDCSEAYENGTQVTLTATGTGESSFTGWSGDCTGTGTCQLTMNANKAVTATFDGGGGGGTRTLSVTAPTNGSIEGDGIDCPGDCSEVYAEGEQISLEAVADPGFDFGSWGGACASDTDDFCNLTMNTNKSVSATFAPEGSFDVDVDLAGTGTGTVTGPGGINCPATSCLGFFDPGAEVTLVATPTGGSTFAGWSGDCTGTGNCVLTVTEDMFVTATFTGGSTLAPDTDITKAKVSSKKRTATFSFEGTGGEGLLSYECKLDKGDFEPCTSKKKYTKLKRKKHNFQVRAVDSLDRADPTPAKHGFKIKKSG